MHRVPQSIDSEYLNTLPLRKYQGVSYVVHTREEIETALVSLSQESILGFDTESRPSFQKGYQYPPALVQLAASRAVYLFPLHNDAHLEALSPILSNPNVLKVGVAINDDIRHLRSMYDFNPQGFVEISQLSKKLGIKYTGLRNLAGLLLKLRISKAAQTSNWARSPLTLTQISYAATDAWISRELYLKLAQYQTSQSSVA